MDKNRNIKDKEMQMLSALAGAYQRHPDQVNNLSEADAEILKYQHPEASHLVLKIDGLYEELQDKLYTDPYQIGWMSVTITISDLSAVGSDPFGVLMALQLPNLYGSDTEWMRRFQEGVNAACKEYGVFILGGDTNLGEMFSITCSGAAMIKDSKPMLRKGMQIGDYLYATGQLGIGSAFAFSRYFDNSIKVDYLPVARLKESKLIRTFAHSCIDTSDGFFPALSILSTLNETGFDITTPLEGIIHPDALKICRAKSIAPWIFLAGPHGEYELIFSIAPEQKELFETTAMKEKMPIVLLGKAVAGAEMHFTADQLDVVCQPAEIANLFQEAEGNVQHYFEKLVKQHIIWSQKQ